MKKIVFLSIIIGLLLFGGTGCNPSPIEKLNTDSSDPKLEFETVHKEIVYVDKNDWFVLNIGYKYPENTFINSPEQLEKFFQNSKIFFDSSDIDFNEYMLYVDSAWDIETLKTYDIFEISYNSKVFDALIDYTNSKTYENHDENKKLCYYIILKIKKSEFPYEPRDYLRHQKYN